MILEDITTPRFLKRKPAAQHRVTDKQVAFSTSPFVSSALKQATI